MKNKIKIKIIIALISGISFYACNDSLITDKPQSSLNQAGFYNTEVRINDGIMGCYNCLQNVTDNEWRFTEIRSDNTCVSNVGTGTPDRADICDLKFFRTSPSQTGLLNLWYLYFQSIANVNGVLPSVATGHTVVTLESHRAQYEGELLFMRAYLYYNLVNLWGDMFKVTTVIGPLEALKIPRSPVSEIYNDIIIPDLIKAASQLPESYSTNDVGRITKWAAKSLLAKSYMMIGGDANLTLAKGLLEEVMAAPQHHLQTTGITIGGITLSPYASIFDVTNEMNPEIIFAIRYKGGAFGIGSNFWGTFAPEGSSSTFLKVGTPIGNNNPTPELMALFNADPTDTRTDACFRSWLRPGSTVPINYISKYIDPNISQALQAENDWIEIRYADIVLLHAEVAAQQNDYATALIDVNKIRTRAKVKPYISFNSKTEALDSVYTERRKELAFENQRWFDLLRMGKAYGDPNKAISILTTSIFTTDWTLLYSLYSPILPPTQGNFTNARFLLPIPQQEIDTNNEMVIPQNPGY